MPVEQQQRTATHRNWQQQSDEVAEATLLEVRSLCCIDSAAYIDMAADFEEGDGADSVGATSAAANEGGYGDEGRCWGDGGRRWRWPTVGAVGVRWCCAFSGGLWWCQKDVIL